MRFIPFRFIPGDRLDHVPETGRFFLRGFRYDEGVEINRFRPVVADADVVFLLQANGKHTQSAGSRHVDSGLQGFRQGKHIVFHDFREGIYRENRKLFIHKRNGLFPLLCCRSCRKFTLVTVFGRRHIPGHGTDLPVKLQCAFPDLVELVIRQRRHAKGGGIFKSSAGFIGVAPAFEEFRRLHGERCIPFALGNQISFFSRRFSLLRCRVRIIRNLILQSQKAG